jgi:hypothetical protein
MPTDSFEEGGRDYDDGDWHSADRRQSFIQNDLSENYGKFRISIGNMDTIEIIGNFPILCVP